MARYLVVEFDEDRHADSMRKRIDAATDEGKPFRVVGVFGRPTKWCSCPAPEGYHKNELVRGSRFGWWVHVVCKRARLGSHQCVNLMALNEVAGLSDEGLTFRVDGLSIFEVPVANIRE
jgi:hypothetical protein